MYVWCRSTGMRVPLLCVESEREMKRDSERTCGRFRSGGVMGAARWVCAAKREKEEAGIKVRVPLV